MKYVGSKNRIAKEILPIILKNRKEGQLYVEPFVGGANVIDKVVGRRIGSDTNEYLIALLNAVSKGDFNFIPDSITEDEYNHIKNNKNIYSKELVGFCGFNSTFGAKWFGGYARQRKNGFNRDVICGKNILLKQHPLLFGVKFLNISYIDLELNELCIIYCDPPYNNTTSYKDKFNSIEFWQWCRDMTIAGHTVYISEYNAPDDFECIWSKKINCPLAKDNKDRIEKLFIYKNTYGMV